MKHFLTSLFFGTFALTGYAQLESPSLIEFKDDNIRETVSCWSQDGSFNPMSCDIQRFDCHFATTAEARQKKIVFEDVEIYFFPYQPKLPALSSYAFLSLPQIKLGEEAKDISSYYVFHKGILKLKREHEKELIPLFENKQIPEFQIKGDCAILSPKGIVREYEVYDVPGKEKKLLGKIVFEWAQGKGIFSWIGQNQTKESFTANLVHGQCGFPGERRFYHQIFNAKDGWVDIGSGKWGQHGWIESSWISIYSEKAPLFKISGLPMRLHNSDQGISARQQLVEAPEGTPAATIDLRPDDLVDGQGKLKIPIYCDSLGC